jgi:hypothetical protein
LTGSLVVGAVGTVNADLQEGQWNCVPASSGEADKSQKQDGHLNDLADPGTWMRCPQPSHFTVLPKAEPSMTWCFEQCRHLNNRSATGEASWRSLVAFVRQPCGERKHQDHRRRFPNPAAEAVSG